MEQANWLLTIHSDANPQVYRTIVNDFNRANSNSKKKFSVEFSTLFMYRLIIMLPFPDIGKGRGL